MSQTGASWTDASATSGGVELGETISGLIEDMLYRWRARVLYAPHSVDRGGDYPTPKPAHGPWRRVSAQANDADIRVAPEPGAIASLASGLALLSPLHRRRKAAARNDRAPEP